MIDGGKGTADQDLRPQGTKGNRGHHSTVDDPQGVGHPGDQENGPMVELDQDLP